MIAIPITNDQPGVAARLAWLGAAEVVPPQRLTVPRLRAAIERVLRESGFREAAQRCREKIRESDGVANAADIVEQVLATKARVCRAR